MRKIHSSILCGSLLVPHHADYSYRQSCIWLISSVLLRTPTPDFVPRPDLLHIAYQFFFLQTKKKRKRSHRHQWQQQRETNSKYIIWQRHRSFKQVFKVPWLFLGRILCLLDFHTLSPTPTVKFIWTVRWLHPRLPFLVALPYFVMTSRQVSSSSLSESVLRPTNWVSDKAILWNCLRRKQLRSFVSLSPALDFDRMSRRRSLCQIWKPQGAR